MNPRSFSVLQSHLLIRPGKTDHLQMFEVVISQVFQKILLHSIGIVPKYHLKV